MPIGSSDYGFEESGRGDGTPRRGWRPGGLVRRTFTTLQHKLAGEGEGEFSFQGKINKDPGLQNTHFESLDYDYHENTVFMDEVRKKKTRYHSFRLAVFEHTVTIMIGVVTAIIGLGIDMGTKAIARLKFSVIEDSIERYNTDGYMVVPTLYFLLFNVALVLVASLLVLLAPVATGSGIPEIKCYLNGIKVPYVMRFKTLVVKAVGVLFSVASGLPVGKEGPMIHSGAIVAAGLSQFKSTTFKLFDMHMGSFRNDRAKRDFVSAGAAAGVATAFGAPIGGVLFALEEGSSFWNLNITFRTFLCAMTATFTLNLLLSGIVASWGDLSNPGLVNFGSFDKDRHLWAIKDLAVFVVMGACGGLAGALFNGINRRLTSYRTRHLHRRHNVVRVLEAVLIMCVTTVVLFGSVMLFGECGSKVTVGDDSTRDFFCPDGYYNDFATLSFNSMEEALRQLFHNHGEFSLRTLAIFMVLFFFLTCWTYGAAVPSGIFVPSLLTGAAFGRLVGEALKLSSAYGDVTYTGTYALIGAAAFLGGVIRMTISLTVILIESTNNVTYGLPLMVTVLVAKWVGDRFDHSLYDIHIHLQKVPLLGWEPPSRMKDFFATHVMTEDPVSVKPIMRVGDLVHVLSSNNHNAFPVVDLSMSVHPRYTVQASAADNRDLQEGVLKTGRGLFLGLVLRKDLTVLLQQRAFGPMSKARNAPDAERLPLRVFTRAYPRHPLVSHIHLSPGDEDMFIDMTLYMAPAPYTVQQISPLPRVFALFRGLGLRHLPVVDRYNQLVGIITRRDLCYLEFHLHQHFEIALGPSKGLDARSFSRRMSLSTPTSPHDDGGNGRGGGSGGIGSSRSAGVSPRSLRRISATATPSRSGSGSGGKGKRRNTASAAAGGSSGARRSLPTSPRRAATVDGPSEAIGTLDFASHGSSSAVAGEPLNTADSVARASRAPAATPETARRVVGGGAAAAAAAAAATTAAAAVGSDEDVVGQRGRRSVTLPEGAAMEETAGGNGSSSSDAPAVGSANITAEVQQLRAVHRKVAEEKTRRESTQRRVMQRDVREADTSGGGAKGKDKGKVPSLRVMKEPVELTQTVDAIPSPACGPGAGGSVTIDMDEDDLEVREEPVSVTDDSGDEGDGDGVMSEACSDDTEVRFVPVVGDLDGEHAAPIAERSTRDGERRTSGAIGVAGGAFGVLTAFPMLNSPTPENTGGAASGLLSRITGGRTSYGSTAAEPTTQEVLSAPESPDPFGTKGLRPL